ncbi:MAG: hypothetical protein ACOCUS_03650 [Polyangiales bacterium]
MRLGLRLGVALVGAGCAVLALGGRPAQAQYSEDTDPPRSFDDGLPPPNDALWPGSGELGMVIGAHGRGQGGGSFSSLSPTVRGHYFFSSRWGVHLALPFVQISVDDVDGTSLSATRSGNVAVGAQYKLREGDTDAVVGLSIATPTARIKGTEEAQRWTGIAYETAIGVRGGRERWLFAPERLSPVVRGAVVHRLLPEFGVLADAELAVLAPVGDAAGKVELFASAAAGAAWMYRDMAKIGAELSLAVRPTPPDSVDDPVQTALKAFARFEPGSYFLEAAFLVNLDDPYGVSFRPRRVWGLFVGFGAKYD